MFSADNNRYPCAEYNSAEDIPTELICAKQVIRRWWHLCFSQVLKIRISGSNPFGEQRKTKNQE